VQDKTKEGEYFPFTTFRRLIAHTRLTLSFYPRQIGGGVISLLSCFARLCVFFPHQTASPMLRATETGDDPAYFEKLEERRRRRNCQIQVRVVEYRSGIFRTARRRSSHGQLQRSRRNNDGNRFRDNTIITTIITSSLFPPHPLPSPAQQRVLAAVILSAVFYVLFLVVSQVYRGKRDRRFAGSYSRRNRTNSGTGGVVRGL
jgi:hypothetical protein